MTVGPVAFLCLYREGEGLKLEAVLWGKQKINTTRTLQMGRVAGENKRSQQLAASEEWRRSDSRPSL